MNEKPHNQSSAETAEEVLNGIYSEVYVDDDKDMGDAMRAALTAALSRPK